MLSAQEFFDSEKSRFQDDAVADHEQRNRMAAFEHPDYMDFSERYADYVVGYEKGAYQSAKEAVRDLSM